MDEATGIIAGAKPVQAAPDEPAAPPSETDRAETTADGAGPSTPAASTAPAAAEDSGARDQRPAGAAAQAPESAEQPDSPDQPEQPRTTWPGSPGFRERGRMRRRLAFLRRARELGYRDLGGLVFNLHRFGQRHDELVLAKLGVLERLDTELRSLEGALRERRAATVLRVAGITACPRCAAIHASEDRFCPNCGLQLGRHPDLPIAGPTEAAAPAANGPSLEAPATQEATSGAQAAGAPSAPATAAHAPDGQTTASNVTRPPVGADDGEPTEVLRPPSE